MMLPGIDGLEVLRQIRCEGNDVPVMFCTANESVEDRVAAFAAGGNDYLTKPFRLAELVARLRVLVVHRRPAAVHREDATLTLGDLIMDEDERQVTRGGDLITLTATEFELLRYLMRNPRRILSRAQILDRVWSHNFGGSSNVVDLYISYLRKKIDTGREPMIHTARGAGYIIKAP